MAKFYVGRIEQYQRVALACDHDRNYDACLFVVKDGGEIGGGHIKLTVGLDERPHKELRRKGRSVKIGRDYETCC